MKTKDQDVTHLINARIYGLAKKTETRRKKGEEVEIEVAMEIFLSLCLIVCCSVGLYFYNTAWLQPERIRRRLRKQGINGPPPSFLSGNLSEMKRAVTKEKTSEGTISHEYTVFPYLDQWRKDYGPVFIYSLGNAQALHVSNPDLVKDISHCISLDLGKSTYLRETHKPLFGDGIIKSNGNSWAYQRKIVAPQFFLDKVKGMVDLMVDSAIPLLKSWEGKIEGGGGTTNIKVDEDLRSYSADVISRACFGSSFSRGKEIFKKLRALQRAVSKPNLLVGIGLRYFPTKNNREIWRLEKEVRKLILEVVEEGRASGEKNLLQAILQSAGDGFGGAAVKSDDFIVDNCKTIYFTGHETTAITAAWCLMLLAMHPEWQDRVRSEVAEVCKDCTPDGESLPKMKMLTMVIQESLRLYPPGAFITRETLQDMNLGGIHVPKGVTIHVVIPTLHRDPGIWGPDAHQFKPERFANGVLGACKLPHVYVPFGAGTRRCLGQTFAMVELKIILSLLLSRFSFSPSPDYKHSPTFRLVIEPEFGVDLLVKKV